MSIFALLAPRRPFPSTGVSAPRRAMTLVSQAVRSVIAPASLVEAVTVAADPAGLYGPDELPAVEDIEAAAADFAKAADLARAGDRGKRAARKLLDRLPAGRYGAWLVSRTVSSRQTADLEEIRRIFKANGLGPVPMKSSAPSLKVERLAVAAVSVPVLVAA